MGLGLSLCLDSWVWDCGFRVRGSVEGFIGSWLRLSALPPPVVRGGLKGSGSGKRGRI